MNREQLILDYEKYKPFLKSFQLEVYDFLNELRNLKKDVVDIHEVEQRLQNDIKNISSILAHIDNDTEKYRKYKSILDIKDIAGVRITCHCSSDREKIYDLLEGELKQKYLDVIGDKKEGNYRAYHFNFSKVINFGDEEMKMRCEIQLRTVLGNAWAIQDTKYVYKNKNSEGEPRILSGAISNILNSCESLWDLVKEKGRSGLADVEVPLILEANKKSLDTIKSRIIISHSNNKDWFSIHRKVAEAGLSNLGIKTSMEVKSYLTNHFLSKGKNELKDAARTSQINTFGWPIGVFIDAVEEYKPKPDNTGIHAELSIKKQDIFETEKEQISYDYWAIKQDGSFYLLKSLFEDQRRPGYIFFNTRIVRIAESLMYVANLYKNLGVDRMQEFSIEIKHAGLKGRIISASGQRFVRERKTDENESAVAIVTSMAQIEEDLANLVKEFTRPLFEIFDFFSINDEIVDDIVEKFKNGNIT
ncbi:MAG: RelA/SpoT domain-containing protein [Candidatus Moranbacteria bacterium]|nr:RelA/SpoT domain-containing protein [Candidatus Moranbacteria bacterium]